MASIRLRADKRQQLIQAFEDLSAVGNADISRVTGIRPSSLARMLKGEPIGSTDNLRKLFGALVYVPRTGNDPAAAEERKKKMEREIGELIQVYCEPVDRSAKPKPPLQPRPPTALLSCMTVYIKFMHLRDRRTAVPVYHRIVRRAETEFDVDVFDETLYVRTRDYKSTVGNKVIVGRKRGGIVDALPIFPPRTSLLEHYVGKIGSPELVEFIEATPNQFLQTAFLMFNGHQREEGKQYDLVGSIIFEDCDRFVLVVDMTSLPIERDRLLDGPPLIYHMRANKLDYDLLRMSYAETHNGAFVLDSAATNDGPDEPDRWDPLKHRLLENDRLEFRFKINWDAVNEQR